MSLDPPTYLNSLQNNIRTRPIPWEGAVRAGTITDNDLKRIKAVDKVRKEQRKQTVESETDNYRSLLLGSDKDKSVFESAAKRIDVIQYVLVLTGDLINDAPILTSALLEHPDPYKPFLPLLTHSTNPEDPIPLLTSSVLTSLLSASISQTPKSTAKTDDALSKLYTYLSTLTKSPDSGLQDIACQSYSSLLRTKKTRSLFWNQRADTVTPLFDILRTAVGGTAKDTDSTIYSGATSIRSATDAGGLSGVGLQLLYHTLLVIWQLSFEAVLVGKGLEKDHELLQLYTLLIRLSPKEKTTRLLLSTLLNLFSPAQNKDFLLPIAGQTRLPQVLSMLQTRHLTDPDLLEDLKSLSGILEEYTSGLTTLDSYLSELSTGHLTWSPCHKSASFWRENARAIIDGEGGAHVKALVEILSKGWEGEKGVLAVGCNDVGWLVKEAPERRGELEKLGVKGRVMGLMQDESEEVRYEALRAVGEWLKYSFE